MLAEDIKSLLEQAFNGDKVAVIGETGKFHVEITSNQFVDLNRVKQQQLVYSALNSHIKSGEIHAVTMTLETPSSS